MPIRIKPLLLRRLLCCGGFVCAALASGVAVADIYKYVDENGRVTYSNVPMKGAKKLDLEPLTSVPMPKPRPKANGNGGAAVSEGAVSAEFPRVDADTQKKRDLTRRGILEDELRSEEKAVADARRAYEEGGQTLKVGEESRSAPKYVERMGKLKDALTTRENNVQALRKELANLK